jgi:MoaA/NifB/PqqE/SkfB family radical SAM enzyme
LITHLPNYKPRVVFRTTSSCNYRCRMCFWSRPEVARDLQDNDKTMSMDIFRRILNEVMPYCSELSLTDSGEFLTDPLWEERLSILADTLRRYPKILFNQNTNASLLTRDRLNFFRGISRIKFMISIDTVDALTYASIRRPGTLSNVLDNIRSLRGNLSQIGINDVQLQLSMVLMKRNIFSIPKTMQFAKEINASLFVDHPQGFGPDDLYKESLFWVPAFTNDFLNKCGRLAKSLNVPFDRPPPFAISDDEVAAYCASKTTKTYHCLQLDLYGPITISANGDFSVCCQNLVFGNLNNHSFEELFLTPRYSEYRKAIADGNPLPPCDSCRWLYRYSPYLYDSSAYSFDIPVESRNLDVAPDFEKEGFFDWMDELSEKQLRNQLRMDYVYQGKRLHNTGLNEEIELMQRQEKLYVKIARVFQQSARVMESTLVRWARSQQFIMDNPRIQRYLILVWEFVRRVILRLR